MTASETARRVWRTVDIPVTSTQDGLEHLVPDEAITPGSAEGYVAVCGRVVRAAALACPPGPRCPDCTLRATHPRSQRRRHRQRSPWLWMWLNLLRRSRHRTAWVRDGALDAD